MNSHYQTKEGREEAIQRAMNDMGFDKLPPKEREEKLRQMREHGITGHSDPSDAQS